MGTHAKLRLAIAAAEFPGAMREHALEQIEQALMLYHEAPVAAAGGRGRPRDTQLESLLINIAVQFHVAKPTTPGVTKRGQIYSGALVDFVRQVLEAGEIQAATRNLGRLIYSVIRKEAQIHGDLAEYPPMTKKPGDGRSEDKGGRRRQSWTLPTDVTVPDDPAKLAKVYASKRARRRS